MENAGRENKFDWQKLNLIWLDFTFKSDVTCLKLLLWIKSFCSFVNDEKR